VTLRIHSVPVAVLLATFVLPVAARPAELSPQLAPLRPLVGKTWRGEFPESKPGKPVVDVSRYEVALSGQAVRNLHSINDGAYGGESLMVWDKEKQAIVYFYFTTAGFYTTGTLREEDGAIVAHETVKGDADGVSEVKAVFRVLPDGRLHAKTRYLKQGQWVDARDMHYVEAPTAVVKFKD
jgi:hypothetical protein